MEETNGFKRVNPARDRKVDMTGYKPFDYDAYWDQYKDSIMAETARHGVPVTFEQGFRTIDEINQPEAVKAARAWADTWTPEEPKGLIFVGPTGVGKTALAWAVAIALREKRYIVYSNTLIGLLLDIRDSYNKVKGKPSEGELIEAVVDSHVVMLDDIGAEAPSDHAMTVLMNLMDKLYQNRVPLLITTNLDGASLRQHWGANGDAQRVLSRMAEMVTPIKMQGQDLRKQKSRS